LESLKDFKKTSEEIVEAYENINVNESAFLADKNATRDQMQKASEGLNLLREKMYDSYVGLINNMKKNTTDEEWTPISKEFNKL
jgi:hypothetical protein